ncbi:MAG: hypothetical protein RJA24_1842, partial [Pseudomonadota bacterium]
QLQDLAGDYPLPLLTQHFNRWARANNRPTRTARAIEHQSRALGLSLESTGEYISTGTFQHFYSPKNDRIFDRLRRWHSDGLLRVYCIGGHRFVRRSKIRRLALSRPDLFAHLSRSALVQLLDSEHAADTVLLTQPPRPYNRFRPVRCLDTGILYPSVAAAARAVYVSTRAIYNAAVGRSSVAAGYRWAYADAEPAHG